MDQDAWRLSFGYLNFLVKTRRLKLSPREKSSADKFRLSSWLNDMPIFSKDKMGSNIPILILQAMFLLLERRLDEFDNRIEALRKYRQRNLSPETKDL